ncbi:MAG TPA: GvpL/GvpF family gas vesicle protein [Puia sp.]|nr:GvpL/GvpF family gas vesicle protein [Puia sp.]
MKVSLLALGSTLVTFMAVSAAPANPSLTTLPVKHATSASTGEDSTYLRVITERAGKIVATLGLPDSAAFYRVRTIVKEQYRALNAVYTERDERLKQLKDQQPPADKNTSDSIKKNIQQDVDARVAKLHTAYLAKLATELNPQQVDMVKDGMTYNVRTVTFRAYEQMLPQLTDEQKKVIMDDLIEAREHAMDAGSSEKKHAWFGKYKGRINNYLSSQGISMKKASEDWKKRKDAAAGAGTK